MEYSDAYKPPQGEPLPPLKKKPKSLVGQIVGWTIGLLVIGILIGMMLPMVRRGGVPYEAALRSACQHNMRQITLAMLNYESTHGHFPPAYIADETGKPMHSWRVLILPFLERNDLFERYSMDEPWDGPNNRKLADEIGAVFSCSSQYSANDEPNHTDYCIVTGPGTLFESDRTSEFADIKDGSSNTAILVEVNQGEIHWMEPKDLSLDEALSIFEQDSGGEQNSNHPGIQNVAHADGSSHSMSTSTERDELLKLFLIADESGKQNESDETDD